MLNTIAPFFIIDDLAATKRWATRVLLKDQVRYAGFKVPVDHRQGGEIVGGVCAHAAYDLAAVAMIYWNLETRVAHLIFK